MKYYRIALSKGELKQSIGLVFTGGDVIQHSGIGSIVHANVKKHVILCADGKEVHGIKHNVVLNLNDDGERWEGDVLDKQPRGWGVWYDSENRMAYEGFRIGKVNVCYGRSYYPDIGVIEYEGGICNGKRWGRGAQYDRNGKVVYDGEWMNDEQLCKIVVLKEESQLLHNHIEELTVEGNCCNSLKWGKLDFSVMSLLRILIIGSGSFMCVTGIHLCSLPELEEVTIGDDCFTGGGGNDTTVFHCEKCDKLKHISIGHGSFRLFKACIIKDLRSIETIVIGNDGDDKKCFSYASLEMKGKSESQYTAIDMPMLKEVALGDCVLDPCTSVVLESSYHSIILIVDLERVERIRIGYNALNYPKGGSNCCCKMISAISCNR